MARFTAFTMCGLIVLTLTGASLLKEWKSGIPWQEPEVITPAGEQSAPSDSTVLFDGKDLSAWKGGENWKVADGVATTGGRGGITTKEKFGDCQLHIEWASPSEVKSQGQGRGNSGVYFMEKYEVQILDSYENETYFDGQCGAIYKQFPPLVNATRPPGEWQTYDIIFTAPRFKEDGSLKTPAYLTVLHNGVLIQNHAELQGGTFWDEPPSYKAHAEQLPIHIQNHGNPVRFRNIWIRNVEQLPARQEAEKQEA